MSGIFSILYKNEVPKKLDDNYQSYSCTDFACNCDNCDRKGRYGLTKRGVSFIAIEHKFVLICYFTG